MPVMQDKSAKLPGSTPAEPPALDQRAEALKALMVSKLNEHEQRLQGRPFNNETLAEVVALCFIAAEDAGGSREAMKETLKPRPRQVGGFDPLWSLKTFELVEDRGVKGIKCLRCNRTSFHPEDVANRYCGYCHEYHDGE